MAAAVPPAAIAAVPAAAAAPHVVIFADAPGLIDGQPIDYGTAKGAKAFKAASKELTIKFDCLPGSLKVFLANLQDRALINGWERILNDPEDATVVNGPTRYLLSEYGNISLRQVAAHAAIYLPQQVRARQGSMQLYHCIMSCIPICISCLFGKATRRPWRSKVPGNPQGAAKTLTRPGESVSVDQMKSPTLGLAAQLRGKPTKARYKVATVFIDHVSRPSYVHLQKTTSADETVEAKQAFERFASANGVKVLHYHADNGIFADNQARTMLIHAQKRWPSAITAALWPYALRQANELLNGTPNIQIQEKVPIAVFAKTNVAPNPKHWFSF
jgi:hypothetical protein